MGTGIKLRTEKQAKIREGVKTLVLEGKTPKEIIDIYSQDIDNSVLKKRTLYKYISECYDEVVSSRIVETIRQNVSPENTWIADFIDTWSKVFRVETERILKSKKKYKIPEFGIYIRQLEQVYKLYKEITPQKSILSEREISVKTPLKMPDGEYYKGG